MILTRIAPSILFSCLLSLSAASLAARPATKQKLNIPPSANLSYAIKSKQNGLSLSGQAAVRWTNDGSRYSLSSEARAVMLGKILESRSEGLIDEQGLVPVKFTQKRFRKDGTMTLFDHAANTIKFSRVPETYPIKGGEQDIVSVVWQLVSQARTTPTKLKPNSEWRFSVAGDHDVDPWTFKVVKYENIRTALGTMSTLHIARNPLPGSKKQKLDIWLAPSMEWYPVRIRFSEADGEYIEQTLEQVGKTVP